MRTYRGNFFFQFVSKFVFFIGVSRHFKCTIFIMFIFELTMWMITSQMVNKILLYKIKSVLSAVEHSMNILCSLQCWKIATINEIGIERLMYNEQWLLGMLQISKATIETGNFIFNILFFLFVYCEIDCQIR